MPVTKTDVQEMMKRLSAATGLRLHAEIWSPGDGVTRYRLMSEEDGGFREIGYNFAGRGNFHDALRLAVDLMSRIKENQARVSKLSTSPETGDILRASFYSECESWEIECENAAFTVLLGYDGTVLDATIWRDGKAERFRNDKVRPILEAAIAHHKRDCDDALS